MLAAADHAGGRGNAVDFVLDRLDGRACGDAAEKRDVHRVVGGSRNRRRTIAARALKRDDGGVVSARGGGLRQLDHFERPGPVWQAAQEATLLKRCDEPVDAGLGREIERFLHLVERRRHARLFDPLMDEEEEFVLFRRKHALLPKERIKNVSVFYDCSWGASSCVRARHFHNMNEPPASTWDA